MTFYNLDAVISVGYRVNSLKATQFRQWATAVLRDFAVRGYVLDKERLKNGSYLNDDYFEHLIAEIREIRASENPASVIHFICGLFDESYYLCSCYSC